MQRRPRRLVPGWAGTLAVGLGVGLGMAGCGEEYSDQATGVLDLTPVFDKETNLVTNDPSNSKLPTQLDALNGFHDGERAEYYDFGPVATLKDPLTGNPTAALVQPMYFFFTPEGFPLFAGPVRETRDGSDYMPGGKKVLNPNPRDVCAGVDPATCAQATLVSKKTPYPLRRRDYLVDPLRQSADYQRPIIDVTPLEVSDSNPRYTGLWEIIEVVVGKGYDPDAIKHASTLRRAIADKAVTARPTGKVINCPMVDERTYVPRGASNRPIFHPRIELWYRTKLTFCYLANGWETLGDETGRPFFGPAGNVNSDSERLDTFDVSRITLGEDKAVATRIVVPVSKVYIPAIYTEDPFTGAPAVTRLPENVLSQGRPRHFRNDPTGYSPIRWMFDLQVYEDYVKVYDGDPDVQGIRSVDEINPDRVVAQSPQMVRNFPMRGIATPCSYTRDTTKTSHLCGRLVQDPAQPDNPNFTVVDSTGDPTCVAQQMECNGQTCYCDDPLVGYAKACGPGIARCSKEKDSFSEVGYTCFPPWGGFCFRRCEGHTNLRSADNKDKKITEFVDSRCGELKGFNCILPYQERDFGICLKFCDQNVIDPSDPAKIDTKQCAATTMVGTETKDINDGQTCQNYGLQVCAWPDGYTP